MTAPAVDLHAEAERVSEQLADLERTLAPLRAVHGRGGTWDADRKAMVSGLVVALKADGEKLAATVLEAMAHADARYARWLNDSAGEKTRLLEGEAEVARLARKYELLREQMWGYRAEVKRFGG